MRIDRWVNLMLDRSSVEAAIQDLYRSVKVKNAAHPDLEAELAKERSVPHVGRIASTKPAP